MYSLAVDPKNPSTVYAGGHYSDDGGNWHIALFKSPNRGGDWDDISSGMDDENQPVYALAIDPDSTQIIYAGTRGGIYRTSDGGLNWANTCCGFDSVCALLIIPSCPSTIYAATAHGVYRSTDRGSNWLLTNRGLTFLDVSSLGVSAPPSEIVYVGTRGGGVFALNDVAVDETRPQISTPHRITLYQNRPNPFSHICSIAYSLPSRIEVSLIVYDTNGRFVCQLVDGLQDSGMHTARWDGRDTYGRPVPSNSYFCLLRAAELSATKKMVLVR